MEKLQSSKVPKLIFNINNTIGVDIVYIKNAFSMIGSIILA